ncbi:MAG TPA: AMP-dependent synthetase, partial [Candidatus Marinimicrobia bacterium]|nr:AMP-dependent synthetase [Candidatus Neomarinimicrobiota bacterium]
PILFFATMRIGAILVPLNFRLTAPELDILLKDSEPRYIIYEETLLENISALYTVSLEDQGIALEIFTSLLEKTDSSQTVNLHQPDFEDCVMILYTSGTTGIPKGAMITHKMLFYNSINTEMRLDITSQDHTLGFAPFFHTGGWNVLLTPFIHHGASLTLLDKFDADTILELIEKEKVSLLFGVPTMLQMMSESPKFPNADLSSMRYIIVGGAAMPIPLIRLWHERGIYIRQGYGLTEVGPNCYSLHHDDAEGKIGSIGFPNFYIEPKVINEKGSICGPDEVGELLLKSPVVTPGYWRKPKETAAAIEDGWFHTGDMVRYDNEGFYYVVDRKKNMFISGGENVYPAEIEALINGIIGVVESSIIGIPHAKWGEVGKAYIVRRNPDLTADSILEYCKSRLAKFKIPKEIVFIEALPRNEAGKIDRKKLEEMHKILKEN